MAEMVQNLDLAVICQELSNLGLECAAVEKVLISQHSAKLTTGLVDGKS